MSFDMNRWLTQKNKSTAVKNNYSSHGASHEKKSFRGWVVNAGSALEDIESNIEVLRERSRDLFMGAPIATGALRTMTTNIVGSGLRLNTQIDYEFLGMTREEADFWETNVEREFALWSESTSCDLQRMNDFYKLQELAFLSQLMSGDVFALLPYHKRLPMPYELTIQLVEADRICNPNGTLSHDARVVNGVEIDGKGEVIAYHIAEHHPKSSFGINNKWQRIEKYGVLTGRPNVLHMVNMERPGQRRGVPILAPVIESLKQLTRYSDAELMAAVISGMYTVFIEKQPTKTDDLGGVSYDEQIDGENDDTIEIGNGAVNFLEEGETIKDSNPGRPNSAFDGFVTSICRQIGVALEIPYEVLMKHFTSSYSASRGALLEAWKMFRKRRSWVANSFCQPIYEEWLSEAVAKGRVRAPGFFNNPLVKKAYCKAEWNGPTQGQLDPKKEVEAAELRVQGGYSTRTKETIELTGGDYFANHELRVQEEKLREAAGFTTTAKGAAAKPANENDQEDENDADDK